MGTDRARRKPSGSGPFADALMDAWIARNKSRARLALKWPKPIGIRRPGPEWVTSGPS